MNFLSGDDKGAGISELDPDEAFGMPWVHHPEENLQTSRWHVDDLTEGGAKNKDEAPSSHCAKRRRC